MVRTICAAGAWMATVAMAAGGDGMPKPGEIAEFRVLPGWRTAEGTQMAALHVTLAEGWKTYWRAPGEAGIPPQFDWRRSRNLAGVQAHWPIPEVFHQNGMRAIGYSGVLVLPLELTPKRSGPITLKGKLDFGVCQDVCIPMSVRVSADVAPGGAPDPAIRGALAARPATVREAGVSAVRCSVEPISDGLRVSAQIDMPALAGEEVAVFELPDHRIWVAEASATRRGGTLEAVTEMVPPNNQPFFLQRSDVRITVIGNGQAVDLQGCPSG